MKAFKLAAAVFAGLAMAGCKTEFSADVPLSALQDEGVASLPGTVRLEVPSCNHYEDSRQPSDALVKAQEMMPRIFPSAEFAECYSQNMSSWAEFSLELPIDRRASGNSHVSDDAFNLTASGAQHFGISAPPALLERLDQARRAEIMMPDFDYAFIFNVINDTGAPFDTTVLSAWVDDYPVHIQPMEIPVGESFSLRLSDVVIDRAIKTERVTVMAELNQLLQ